LLSYILRPLSQQELQLESAPGLFQVHRVAIRDEEEEDVAGHFQQVRNLATLLCCCAAVLCCCCIPAAAWLCQARYMAGPFQQVRALPALLLCCCAVLLRNNCCSLAFCQAWCTMRCSWQLLCSVISYAVHLAVITNTRQIHVCAAGC
jgi:hypothetical protein